MLGCKRKHQEQDLGFVFTSQSHTPNAHSGRKGSKSPLAPLNMSRNATGNQKTVTPKP